MAAAQLRSGGEVWGEGKMHLLTSKPALPTEIPKQQTMTGRTATALAPSQRPLRSSELDFAGFFPLRHLR